LCQGDRFRNILVRGENQEVSDITLRLLQLVTTNICLLIGTCRNVDLFGRITMSQFVYLYPVARREIPGKNAAAEMDDLVEAAY